MLCNHVVYKKQETDSHNSEKANNGNFENNIYDDFLHIVFDLQIPLNNSEAKKECHNIAQEFAANNLINKTVESKITAKKKNKLIP